MKYICFCALSKLSWSPVAPPILEKVFNVKKKKKKSCLHTSGNSMASFFCVYLVPLQTKGLFFTLFLFISSEAVFD